MGVLGAGEVGGIGGQEEYGVRVIIWGEGRKASEEGTGAGTVGWVRQPHVTHLDVTGSHLDVAGSLLLLELGAPTPTALKEDSQEKRMSRRRMRKGKQKNVPVFLGYL